MLLIAILYLAKLIGVSMETIRELAVIGIFASIGLSLRGSIKDQLSDEHASWTIERVIDLATRELVLTASGYNYKTKKQLELRETFPLDQLELLISENSLIDGGNNYHYLIFLQPTKTGRALAKKRKFKIPCRLYDANSSHTSDDPAMGEDVQRVAKALEARLKIPLIGL